jgi:hypothetical protein
LERQLALVRWALKTTMVYEFTETEGKYFSSSERLAFKERFDVPEGRRGGMATTTNDQR